MLAGTALIGAGLHLDVGRVRGQLDRSWDGRAWLSVLGATKALVGYRNLA